LRGVAHKANSPFLSGLSDGGSKKRFSVGLDGQELLCSSSRTRYRF